MWLTSHPGSPPGPGISREEEGEQIQVCDVAGHGAGTALGGSVSFPGLNAGRLCLDWTTFPAVPGAAKPTASPKSDLESVAFEEALKRLESVVEAMETGELPLEKMLSHYEDGMRLAQACQGKLTEAELKIEQLEKTIAGDLAVKPVKTADSEDE
ncbi:MAG: exodeoxyribonuclease VII small subunit [Verrucomicrobia bacterium]|nr:exodeoxyribonuclease VII small subunit [Verrucomicrobiota bacterium]MBI3870677.1 exodeoxyribonuclease VII small subunit [Verrucomicrobiota bacterium]